MLSGSDDVTLRWWDISAGKQLLRLTGHQDYVRAAAVSPSSSDTWASGESETDLGTVTGWRLTEQLSKVCRLGCSLTHSHPHKSHDQADVQGVAAPQLLPVL